MDLWRPSGLGSSRGLACEPLYQVSARGPWEGNPHSEYLGGARTQGCSFPGPTLPHSCSESTTVLEEHLFPGLARDPVRGEGYEDRTKSQVFGRIGRGQGRHGTQRASATENRCGENSLKFWRDLVTLEFSSTSCITKTRRGQKRAGLGSFRLSCATRVLTEPEQLHGSFCLGSKIGHPQM